VKQPVLSSDDNDMNLEVIGCQSVKCQLE